MTTGLESLERWPGQHRGAGWVDRSGRWEAAGAVERPLRLASVTKVLTALGVLVATEEEVLALDEPAGPPGSTVRLLLCHASGLPFEGTTPIAEPGTRRIYGNAAFEHLGDLLAERTGMSWAEYVREAVCRPLGMDATELRGSPAAGAHSTVADLLRLGAELLDPQVILSPETVAEATTAQLPDLDGVLPGFGRQRPNPWGSGSRSRARSRRTGRRPRHLRPRSGTSVRAGASCGSTPMRGWPAPVSATSRSGTGPGRRGPSSATRCSPRREGAVRPITPRGRFAETGGRRTRNRR